MNSDKMIAFLKKILFKNTQKVIIINSDDFEINEIDEDMYTESNFENISQKNSKIKSSKKKIRKTPF